ncbi:unnamed protein product, partial [Mesorhabditis belari]|uniref:Uncharacterized protein n=1 Tax=Mesorhabditis belari TaxID=2138241 RepID=A0AAF3F4W9_9BILA
MVTPGARPAVCALSLIGYLCNGMLIYLIKKNPNSRMGNYRYLILMLTIFNIVYATGHLVVLPLTYMHDFGWCFYSSSFLSGYKFIGYALILGYCSIFAQSTILLAYHFIYRYACICKTEWLEVINTKRAISMVIFCYILYFGLWVAMVHLFAGPTDAFNERIAIGFYEYSGQWPNETALIGGYYLLRDNNSHLHINLRPWIAVCVCQTQMSCMFGVILYCGWSMHRKLSSSEMASERGFRLQKQLFRALLIQFLVPIILEYIPCVAVFFLPLTGGDFNLEWATLAVSSYPIFEPLVVIYFVKEYRITLHRTIFGNLKGGTVSQTFEKTTQQHPHDSHTTEVKRSKLAT